MDNHKSIQRNKREIIKKQLAFTRDDEVVLQLFLKDITSEYSPLQKSRKKVRLNFYNSILTNKKFN